MASTSLPSERKCIVDCLIILTVEPHSSGLFTYPGTIYDYIYRKCLIYPECQLGNGGVRISEAPLYFVHVISRVAKFNGREKFNHRQSIETP